MEKDVIAFVAFSRAISLSSSVMFSSFALRHVVVVVVVVVWMLRVLVTPNMGVKAYILMHACNKKIIFIICFVILYLCLGDTTKSQRPKEAI